MVVVCISSEIPDSYIASCDIAYYHPEQYDIYIIAPQLEFRILKFSCEKIKVSSIMYIMDIKIK